MFIIANDSVFVTFTETISLRSAGTPLHEYVANAYRVAEVDWIDQIPLGAVLVDGEKSDPFAAVEAGQILTIHIDDYHEKPVNTQWQLLWQHDEIAAVHKPSGLAVHRTSLHVYNNLIACIKRDSAWPDAHLLHRLDSDTAGIVLIAKNKQAAKRWQPKLDQLMQRKVYQAVVYGPTDWQDFDLQCLLATKEHATIKSQMFVVDAQHLGKSQFSHSRFNTLGSNAHYSLVECEIFTGRKHQIRTHLAHLGHAIVGDKIYAHQGEYYLKRLAKTITAEDEAMIQVPHHLLWAKSVTLSVEQQSVKIEDKYYPKAWSSFLAQQGF